MPPPRFTTNFTGCRRHFTDSNSPGYVGGVTLQSGQSADPLALDGDGGKTLYAVHCPGTVCPTGEISKISSDWGIIAPTLLPINPRCTFCLRRSDQLICHKTMNRVVHNRIFVSNDPNGASRTAFRRFWTKSVLEYEPFCDDFGPMRLSHVFRFIELLDDTLAKYSDEKIVYCVEPKDPRAFSNAIFLLGAYLQLHCRKRKPALLLGRRHNR